MYIHFVQNQIKNKLSLSLSAFICHFSISFLYLMAAASSYLFSSSQDWENELSLVVILTDLAHSMVDKVLVCRDCIPLLSRLVNLAKRLLLK